MFAMKTQQSVKPRNKYSGLNSNTTVMAVTLRKSNSYQTQKGPRRIQSMWDLHKTENYRILKQLGLGNIFLPKALWVFVFPSTPHYDPSRRSVLWPQCDQGTPAFPGQRSNIRVGEQVCGNAKKRLFHMCQIKIKAFSRCGVGWHRAGCSQ